MSADGSRPDSFGSTPWPPTETSLRHLRSALARLSFWTAVVLPPLYVPLFLADLDAGTRTGAFLALFSLNVVALVGGHSYRE